MLKKLKLKLVAIHMSLVATVLLLILGGIFFIMQKSYKEQSMRMIMDLANTQVGVHNKRKPAPPTPKPPVNYAAIYTDSSGTILKIESSLELSNKDLSDVVSSTWDKSQKEGTLTIGSMDTRYLKLPIPSGMLFILMDRSFEVWMLTRLALVLLCIGILSILALFFISIYLVSRALRPVAIAWDKQRQFIADASHELKTPLTVIQTNIALLLSNEEDTIKNQRKWLIYTQAETKRMAKLVQHLLYLARVDGNEDRLILDTFDLTSTTEKLLLSFEALLFEQDITLKPYLSDAIIISADKEKIKQVWVILLDNAIKNTPKKGHITVSLTASSHKIYFTVTNTGSTIAPEHLDKIFERFYRIDTSRSRESGSYGLGLSIAKAVISQHNGQIRAESSDNLTRFIVELPLG